MAKVGEVDCVVDRATENNDITSICTYANISSLEMPYPRDLNDYWQEPASHFLLPGLFRLPFFLLNLHRRLRRSPEEKKLQARRALETRLT